MMRSRLLILALAAAAPPALAHAGDERLADDPAPQPSQDDLAQAADATADIANLQANAPDPGATAAAAAVPPGDAATRPLSEDIDLSALGLEPGAGGFDDKLNLYGFADFGFARNLFKRDPIFFSRVSKTFAVGNVNVYLAKNLTAKARALVEVRFTFLPNGGSKPDGTAVDATATDATNAGRPQQWGGIVIERAYAEYDITDDLTVRAGHWLTPYGIWNIDHGSPVVIGTSRPYIIGEQIFPEHQTGLELIGTRGVGQYRIGYHATVSNGRGGAEAQSDLDSKLAFGGQLTLETPWGLKLGGSYYRGRFTGLTTTAGQMPVTYLEASYGGDVQYDRGPLHAQAELIERELHYPEGSRMSTPAGFAPDGRDLGTYVLAGYRFDRLWNVMPYLDYQYWAPHDHSAMTAAHGNTVGVNFRPTGSLVLKLQYSYIRFTEGQGFFAGNKLWGLTTQASWVF